MSRTGEMAAAYAKALPVMDERRLVMKKITRRTAIGMTAMAMAGMMLPSNTAFAAEAEGANAGDDEDGADVVISPYHRLVSDDPVVDEQNKKAWCLWEEAMAQALAEGEEIVTVVNPKVSSDANQAIARARKVVSTNTVQYENGGPYINIHYYLTASYNVTSAGRIEDFGNLVPTVTYGLHNPTMQVLGYTKTLIDNGRTLVAKVTLSVTVYPASVAQSSRWEATVYFNSSGGRIY